MVKLWCLVRIVCVCDRVFGNAIVCDDVRVYNDDHVCDDTMIETTI